MLSIQKFENFMFRFESLLTNEANLKIKPYDLIVRFLHENPLKSIAFNA